VNDYFRVIHIPSGPHTPLSKVDILKRLPEFTSNMLEYIQKEHIVYTAIHSHYYLSGLVGKTLRKSLRIPVVMTFHTLGLMKELVSQSKDTGDPIERIPLERDLAHTLNHFVTSSNADKEYLMTLYDCPEAKISIIPPGVDTKLFRPMNKQAAKKYIHADIDHHIILAVGRMDPVKGFDVLLFALKTLLQRNPSLSDHVCLWIVGGDIEQQKDQWSKELQKLDVLRIELGLTTTVRFVPPQPQEALPYYYNAADVLVMPSHYESFGMVALEALSCGTPVITTDVTGISSILKESNQGRIVSANNPLTLATELQKVLFVSQPKIDQKTLETYDWNTIAKKMADMYTTLSIKE
jgi:D-inositol-3-phosphate glycosyltransferase